MPEINPYEPPQSELSQASSEKLRAAAGAKIGRYIVPSLVALQIAAGVLFFLFAKLRDMAPSNSQHHQALVEFFGFSFLGLGLLLILIGLVRGSVMLIIGEVIVLWLFLWWSLPTIH